MTAPDPGLTDLIAAHQVTRGWSDGIEVYICLECGDEWWTASEFAEHVKALVEQHTNGRTAELYEQRDNAIEAGLAAIDRAENAEAKATELEAELEKYRAEERRELEWARHRARDDVRCPRCNLRYGERDQYGCIEPARAHHYDADELRAALEGEQQ